MSGFLSAPFLCPIMKAAASNLRTKNLEVPINKDYVSKTDITVIFCAAVLDIAFHARVTMSP